MPVFRIKIGRGAFFLALATQHAAARSVSSAHVSPLPPYGQVALSSTSETPNALPPPGIWRATG